ncbi:oxidoreductase [Trichoderma evansii]
MAKKSVLVTGCSAGGIGYALAEQFQKCSLTVFATARTVSKMDGLKDLPNITLIPLDVTSPSDIDAAVAEVRAHTAGKLDYLVNNSGQSLHMPTLDQDIESAKAMFEVNFWGVFRMVKAFAPLLIEAKGTVVNIGSINGYLHPPFSGVYSASKAAGHSLFETLHFELSPLNIRVLNVVTGSIRTNISKNILNIKLPQDSFYLPAEIYLEKMNQGVAHPNQTDPSVYAEQTVQDILSGATRNTWRGANSFTTRYLGPILPGFIKDYILTNGTNLDQVG